MVQELICTAIAIVFAGFLIWLMGNTTLPPKSELEEKFQKPLDK